MISLILGRSGFLSYPARSLSSYRAVRHICTRSDLYKEFHMKIKSKAEFIRTECTTLDKFSEDYGALAKEKGMRIEEVFQRMLNGRYENYLIHSRIIEPGRIC